MKPEPGTIIHGDAVEVMRQFDDGAFDAIICDPPYGIKFMLQKWDYQVPGVETWSECLRVLKDGGRLLAFSGARTQHRMICNIEDAGFVVEDCLIWLHGNGFPKHKSKLKPAYEPICLARKGQVSELQIDAALIETEELLTPRNNKTMGYGRNVKPFTSGGNRKGRYPANVVLDEQAAADLDDQVGTLVSGANPKRRKSPKFQNTSGKFDGATDCEPVRGRDSGGPSRFFYCAKASKRERGPGNNHPTVKPVDLMRWLISLAVPAGAHILDPFFGSGTTGVAANLVGVNWTGIEQSEEWIRIARARTAQKGLFNGTED